jgi:thioredoxin-dependent peroxiredoxin
MRTSERGLATMAKNVKPAAKAKTTRNASVTAKAGSESSAMEGRKAPAFELPDQEGKSVSLRDLTARGNVVLYFYPKDMTPGCTTEACSFRDNLAELRALGAEVVGISADSTASHQKFIGKHSLNFPLLSDAGNAVCKAYGVYKKKSLYGREFMGIERTTFIIGREGTIRKVFPKVKVNGHIEEVVAALKELSKS